MTDEQWEYFKKKKKEEDAQRTYEETLGNFDPECVIKKIRLYDPNVDVKGLSDLSLLELHDILIGLLEEEIKIKNKQIEERK